MSHNHSVQYSPSSHHPVPVYTIARLESDGVRYIRFTWVDYTNVIRFRVIPIEYFKKMLKSPRPSISVTRAVHGIVGCTLTEGFTASGEILYLPDTSTYRICAFQFGHASVMGWYEEKVPIPNQDGILSLEVDLCPRALLRRMVDEAKVKTGTEFLVGFETEFVLLQKTTRLPVNNAEYSASNATLSGSAEAACLEEIAEALRLGSVELQMYHAEAALGQYEIVTGPLPPLQAVDALIHTRETIYNVANKHGLRATLTPRLFDGNCGSATHIHISIHPTTPAHQKTSASSSPGLTPRESSFLASLLAHLPAICAFTLPTKASYRRMVDGIWSGGTYVCWGTENREAPVRLCNVHSAGSRNFEFKPHDGTANPYLALAAIIGAGTKGIRDDVKLVLGDLNEGKSAAEMSAGERGALGINQRLPLSLEEARENLKRDEDLIELLGKHVVQTFLSVNEAFQRFLGENRDRLVDFF